MSSIWRLLVVLAILLSGCAAVRNTFSVNNPFVADPSGDQLPLWARTHPNGPTLRTTNGAGNPLSSNTASLAFNNIEGRNRGELLFDPQLMNKHASFNRERIPERVVHAKGQGAFGQFIVTHDVTRYTKAKVFNRVGKVTPVFVRFSSTAGGSSSSDTTVDSRGFAVRLYTEDGNLDFVGLQINPFTVRDPMIFPDLQRSVKKNPATHAKDLNQVFDFISQRPEIIHAFLKVNADNARPGSMRAINGSNVNVNACFDADNTRIYCKFSWQSWQNVPNLSDEETISLAGSQPDYYTTELYNAIAEGNYPKWTFGMQVFTSDEGNALPFNPFDPTKALRFENFPFIPIGVFVLDRNPTDFFSQVEQAALDPGNVVPGIGLSPDKILLARTFAYRDAQRYRLGPNFHLIEVNRPLSHVDGYERDGNMRLSPNDNGDGGPIYFPNSFNGPLIDAATIVNPRPTITGIVSRIDLVDDDNFSQARQYLDLDVGLDERDRIAVRIASNLINVLPEIRARVLVNCIYPLGRQFGDAVVRSLEALENNNNALLG